MDSGEFLAQIASQAQDQTNRMRLVMDSITDEVFNRVPAGGEWTPGQVTDHMIISNTPYLAVMEKAISSAPKSGSVPVKHTFVGKLIYANAGPAGNVPAPKSMIPPPPPTKRERASLWFEQMEIFMKLVDRAREVDISGIKIRNPIVPIFRMTLADFFKILQSTRRGMFNKSNDVQVEFIDLRDKFWWTITGLLATAAAIVLLQLRGLEPPPDPNDPTQNKLMAAEVLRRNLRVTSDAANMRVAKGEWGPRRAKRKVSEAAAEMVQHIRIENIREDEAWEYGEVLWTAKQWDKAAEVLELAVKNSRGEERRVNDLLRLAQCYVALEQIDKGLAMARRALDAKSPASEALIPSLLFELVPLAQDQGRNVELANLLEAAIPVYDKTTLQKGSQRERDFIIAKPHLIKRAHSMAAWLRSNPKAAVTLQ